MFTTPFQYLELTGRETEFVALSRDTTESDLKQRREIRDGTAHYVDQVRVSQCPVCTEIAEIIPYGKMFPSSKALIANYMYMYSSKRGGIE